MLSLNLPRAQRAGRVRARAEDAQAVRCSSMSIRMASSYR
jgi:hypothetical protein